MFGKFFNQLLLIVFIKFGKIFVVMLMYFLVMLGVYNNGYSNNNNLLGIFKIVYGIIC